MKHAATIIGVIAIVLIAGCHPNSRSRSGPQTIEIGEFDPPAAPLSGANMTAGQTPIFDVPPPAIAAPPTAPGAPGEAAVTITTPLPPPPPSAPVLPTPPPAAAESRVHVVQPNETLWKISGMYYGRSSRDNVAKIVGANPGLDPDRIMPGQQIVIPD